MHLNGNLPHLTSPLRGNSLGIIHRQTLALCLQRLPNTPTLTADLKSYGNRTANWIFLSVG